MAFPFAFVPGFRQRLLLAIGTTSLASAAAFGCTSQPIAVAPGGTSSPSQTLMGAAAGSTQKPVVGSAGKQAESPMSKPPTAAAGKGGASSMLTVIAQGGVSGVTTQAGMSGMIAQAGESGMLAQAGMSGMIAQAGMSGSAGHAGVASPGNPVACSRISASQCLTRAQMESQAKYGCGMIANPPARLTDAEVQTHFLPNGCLEHQLACNSCCNPALEAGVPETDGSCCYVFCDASCCGRPLLVEGQARLAGLERRSDWLQEFDSTAAISSWDARIASEWAEDARMEHASIASFARFTLDLLAFGAPSELVELAQRAALDEIEHARMCFGLAARYGARDCGPGPLAAADVRVAVSLWHAAVAAFEEGCVGETLAALQAQAALESATDPEVRCALAQITRQEASHAELAWRFVSWSSKRLGPQLVRELERRFAQLNVAPAPTQVREPIEAVAALHAAGRLTSADKHRIGLHGLREVIAPCLAALTDSVHPAATNQHALQA